MSALPLGVEGRFIIRCLNPGCGAVYESERLEVPPDWTQVPEGFLCPRERVVVAWEPVPAQDIALEAIALDAQVEAQAAAELRAMEDALTAAEEEEALAARRADIQRRLAEQEAAEAALREQMGRETEATIARAKRADRVRRRLLRAGGVVARNEALAAVAEHFGELSTDERAAIVELVMSGVPA